MQMSMTWKLRFVASLAVLSLATPAVAVPIVAVDVDPGTPGIQDSGSRLVGSSFTVDIVVSDVTGSGLNAFELDLDFDPSILTATSVVDGGFLLDPSIVVQLNVGSMTVEFAEVTLLPTGATGSGVLATVSFDAIGQGISPLDLNDVLLSAPFGVPVPSTTVDGVVTIVPEPATAGMLGLGLLGLALAGRRSA